ncbi:MAG: hypothetical protein RBS07_08035 [Lentimicrobium sp.]|jgi:hypothetical protein|nr:hypothetical protein [Lentimicrobium sp.]
MFKVENQTLTVQNNEKLRQSEHTGGGKIIHHCSKRRVIQVEQVYLKTIKMDFTLIVDGKNIDFFLSNSRNINKTGIFKRIENHIVQYALCESS